MVKYLIPLLMVALMAGGCRKKRQPEAASPPETAPPAEVPAAAGTQLKTSVPPPATANRTATEADVAAYNQNLSAWINSRDEVPKTLEELKKLNGLPFLPNPPPGKKYVYVPRFDRPTWSAVRME